jgi:hypothetical protein
LSKNRQTTISNCCERTIAGKADGIITGFWQKFKSIYAKKKKFDSEKKTFPAIVIK